MVLFIYFERTGRLPARTASGAKLSVTFYLHHLKVYLSNKTWKADNKSFGVRRAGVGGRENGVYLAYRLSDEIEAHSSNL